MSILQATLPFFLLDAKTRRKGSWGTPEYGLTEKIADIIGAGRVPESGGSNIRGAIKTLLSAPSQFSNQVELYGSQMQPIRVPIPSGSDGQVLGSTTTNRTQQANTRTNTQNTSLPQIPFDDIRQQIEARRQAALAQASGLFDAARQQYEQGMNLLNERRNQFRKMFEDTAYDIDQAEEQKKGQLQRSALEQVQRTARMMRALGLDGSAVGRAEGRQAQENMRALASVLAERMKADRENQRNFNEQMMWAQGQENALQNFLNQAALQRQAIEADAQGNFDDILNQLTMQKAMLEQQLSQAQQYQPQRIAFDPSAWLSAVNNPNMKSLNALTTKSEEQPATLVDTPDILRLVEDLKRRRFTVVPAFG